MSREKVGLKAGASKSIHKPFVETMNGSNMRGDKSKTFYVNEKEYYKVGGTQHLDKSVGEINGRKSENVYARVATSNHPYRKK